ncbi:hypothetical protein AURDEDRAFT_149742 [Auricularia subglabra TFB-10046 SS5]|nr:hypothetical protein AURDEDRAFT_149742 [Auricularia subglabra TFB-10046 SS5]
MSNAPFPHTPPARSLPLVCPGAPRYEPSQFKSNSSLVPVKHHLGSAVPTFEERLRASPGAVQAFASNDSTRLDPAFVYHPAPTLAAEPYPEVWPQSQATAYSDNPWNPSWNVGFAPVPHRQPDPAPEPVYVRPTPETTYMVPDASCNPFPCHCPFMVYDSPFNCPTVLRSPSEIFAHVLSMHQNDWIWPEMWEQAARCLHPADLQRLIDWMNCRPRVQVTVGQLPPTVIP